MRRLPGRVVLVSGAPELREALTRLPLDRLAPGTTGSAAAQVLGQPAGPGPRTGSAGVLFDTEGAEHREARRSLAGRLDAAGVAALRPVWAPVLARTARALAAGADVDVVRLAREVAGGTAAALLGREDLAADALAADELAEAALSVAAEAIGAHLPSWRRRPPSGVGNVLGRLLGRGGAPSSALDQMLVVAAVNTTVAAFPRSVAWAADAGLWADAEDDHRRAVLVRELLRVTAASPVLPRAAAADGVVGGCPVRRGDRLVLVARDAVGAAFHDPCVDDPVPVAVAQLVFGAGSHACPGAGLARAQLDDLLAALAPSAPVVVRAVADGRAALPSWSSLVVRAGSR